MTENWWLVGLAGLGTTLALARQQLQTVWGYLTSLLIVPVYLDPGWTEWALAAYCKDKLRRAPFGARSYMGLGLYVKPLRRILVVGIEHPTKRGGLYWRGWCPIWVQNQASQSHNAPQSAGNPSSGPAAPICVSYLRGFGLDCDRLVQEILDHYNEVRGGRGLNLSGRHKIRFIFGTAKKPPNNPSAETAVGRALQNNDLADLLDKRVLRWSLDDLGQRDLSRGSALAKLSLNADAEALVQDVRRWQASEDWFRERGIPWKRSARLVGLPGTGKTALVRAIAEDLDLPVFVFDLASLYNDELRSEWNRILGETPCIALLEDIDNVFHGRRNITGDELTFDALLNCLDGVERSDGLFTVLTTNDESQLDAALIRPGRCGCRVEMGLLDQTGRYKMADRILADWPAEASYLVQTHLAVTGAEFEDLCSRRAEELYWAADPNLVFAACDAA